MDLSQLTAVLGQLPVRAWRLHLETPGVQATVSMLRGVWGAALKFLAEPVYTRAFDVGPDDAPRYVLRPADAAVRPAPAVEFLLFGAPDATTDEAFWAAWDLACQRGLGPNRIPFRITSARPLAWDGTPLRVSRTQPGFVLAPLPWPLASPADGCRLEFPAPLRLMRHRRLIDQPALPDLVIAALRRIHALAGAPAEPLWADRAAWLDLARRIPSRTWVGHRLDLVRYSGSQQRELEMHGVTGSLDLPGGPGPLEPLLAAATWLHLGKGTVLGLGQLGIRPLEHPRPSRMRTGRGFT
jgi:hypothetical protein